VNIPVPLKIAALVLGTTGLYTYIGQLVPQKIVPPPPPEIKVDKDATPAELAALGAGLANGKGLCFTCHTVGKSGPGMRFPDLDGVATRAASRIEGMEALHYLAHSVYFPDEFIVEGFNPGMPRINKPPIGLSDQEMLMILAWLQSLGGTPTVTPETTLEELGIQ
jgi:mono/diheme cytochrome c family protein